MRRQGGYSFPSAPVAEGLSLLLADPPIVVGQVQFDIGLQDQAVVADHRNVTLLRGFDDSPRRFRAVRDHHQRLHATLEQRLGLLQLPRIVALGGLDQNVGVQLLGALEEQVAVPLPAFFLRSVSIKRPILGRGSCGCAGLGDDGPQETRKAESMPRTTAEPDLS